MTLSTKLDYTYDSSSHTTDAQRWNNSYLNFFTFLCGAGLPSGWRVIASSIPTQAEIDADPTTLFSFGASIDTGYVKFYLCTTGTSRTSIRIALYNEESGTAYGLLNTSYAGDNDFFVNVYDPSAPNSYPSMRVSIREVYTATNKVLLFYGIRNIPVFVVGTLSLENCTDPDIDHLRFFGQYPFGNASAALLACAFVGDTAITATSIYTNVAQYRSFSGPTVPFGLSDNSGNLVIMPAHMYYSVSNSSIYLGQISDAVCFRRNDAVELEYDGHNYINIIPYAQYGTSSQYAYYTLALNLAVRYD